MKVKYLTFLGTALVLTTTCKIAAAQSSGPSTDVKLTPAAQTLLCKEFPQNSRCSSTSTPASSTPPSTTPANPPTSEQQTAPVNSDHNGTTPSGTNPPGNPNTTKPGSTIPPVGLPPSPGSQKQPYITPH
ncbi:MAG: hypothetical protein JOZ78_01375 [Chroococcidiopsidaceae cyanobacterium CP_BM_ER_R8_30]|nr:hypothetical protein [Chroococcidiopsidaceae cyanobacterium CP_BM_ER_R8_30]